MPFLKASKNIARSLRGRGVRLVHCADILGAYFAGVGARMAGARLVSHVRNPYPDLGRRERALLYAVQQFVFISKAVRAALPMPERRKRGPLIYDVPGAILSGVRSRTDARRFFDLPDSVPVVGVAARVSPQKDYPTLIRAAKIVSESLPQVLFLIAADVSGATNREYIEQMQALVDETGTRPFFRFAGFQQDMSWFFGAIDCLALSSNVEGLGSVLLDAIQHGKALVGTDIDGIPEVIIDEQTGLLSRPHAPDHLAAQILRLLKDPDLASRLQKAASARFEETFGAARFDRQVAELYSGLKEKR
jgi:glycosyltransferase involved in cell wall biosynthesis